MPVRLCANHELVRAINRDTFKLEVNQRCKITCWNPFLFIYLFVYFQKWSFPDDASSFMTHKALTGVWGMLYRFSKSSDKNRHLTSISDFQDDIWFQYTGDHEMICIASNIMKEVFCYCWRSYVRVKETTSGRIIWIPQHTTDLLWRSFNEFYLSIWKQLDGNQRLLLFVHDDRDRSLKRIK